GAPSPGASLALMLAYLGLPWMRAAPAFGVVIGAVVLVPSLAALALRGGPSSTRSEQTATALVVFSLVTAVMAGLARTADMTPALMPLRYAVFLIPLHVGLWVLALPYLRRAWTARPGLANLSTIGLAVALLGHQAIMAVFAVRTADANLRVIADFREGRRTPIMTATIHPDLAKAQAISDDLKRRGLYQTELRRDPPS
ncbi:MAG: hypothetical protein JSR98_09860, partial [Proteobacteria bacterium]|nr:hypothetical protein [Pseudomonadota bacterium]